MAVAAVCPCSRRWFVQRWQEEYRGLRASLLDVEGAASSEAVAPPFAPPLVPEPESHLRTAETPTQDPYGPEEPSFAYIVGRIMATSVAVSGIIGAIAGIIILCSYFVEEIKWASPEHMVKNVGDSKLDVSIIAILFGITVVGEIMSEILDMMNELFIALGIGLLIGMFIGLVYLVAGPWLRPHYAAASAWLRLRYLEASLWLYLHYLGACAWLDRRFLAAEAWLDRHLASLVTIGAKAIAVIAVILLMSCDIFPPNVPDLFFDDAKSQ
eukprot:TRINITY_DN19437_c0_g1_i1.p1 TRINITY_DN19437_c0_g1~~TRINITY_DN19437_c0_g1_i1.p1  ORF type:complete len:283 (-),score=22.95 TRINITY_DN19437_c0_g1_i1:685-1491(-)